MIRFLQTPGPLKKFLLGSLLMIICVMMVVTLVPGGIFGDAMGGQTAGVLAKVGSEQITVQEVQNQARQIVRQQFPRGGIPEQYMPIFMRQAADSLIMRNLITSEAQRMGLAASNEEVRYELQHAPIARELFPGGNFIGQEAYENFVSTQFNMSVAQFEQEVKRSITIRKLRAAIEGGVTASNEELKDAYRRQNVKVKFDYAVLTLDDVMKGINPSESELKAFYEQNKNAYENSIPEQRKARYIEITASKLPNPPQVSQEDFQKYYKTNQEQYRVPESITLRHILIRVPQRPDGKVDPKAAADAKAKIDNLLKQAKGGANFADLAKKNTEDPGSKEKGGLYEGIVRGQMDPAFEKAAFATQKGQISDPVQSSFGWHIIKVEEKTEPHLRSLEDVRPQIEPILAQQKLQSELERMSRTVEAASRTQGMDKAATSNGLQVTNTDFFAQSASLPGIGNSPEFMSAVFTQKPMSPPQAVRIPSGYAVVQATQLKPAATPTFEQIRDRVAQEFKQQRAQSLLAQRTQELSDRARAAHNLKAAAKAVGATVRTSDLVSPGQQVPQVGALSGAAEQVFELKPGEISGPIPASGNGVVMQVVDKQEPSPAEFDKQKDQIRESVLERKRAEVMELWASNLRDRMQKDGKIKINEKEMARIAGPVGAQ